MNNQNLSNSSDYQEEAFLPTGFTLTLYLLLPVKICLTLLTALLNTCIIVIILFMIKRQTFSNYIFLGMALADSIIGYISLPFMIIFTTFDYWPLGYAGCAFWVVSDWSSCSVSLYNLCLISVHRFIHIKWPLTSNENLTVKRKILLVSIWIVSYACWTTSILLVTQTDFDAEACYFTYTPIYDLTSEVLAYFFFVLLVIVFNILTYLSLKNKRKLAPLAKVAISTLTKSTRAAKETTNSNAISSGHQSSQMNKKNSHHVVLSSKSRMRNDRNALYCIISIIANLLLTWMLFLIIWPIASFCPECISPTLYEFSYWLVYVYSAVNPMILLAFNESFRAEMKKILSFGKHLLVKNY